jgi:hypothetical protein
MPASVSGSGMSSPSTLPPPYTSTGTRAGSLRKVARKGTKQCAIFTPLPQHHSHPITSQYTLTPITKLTLSQSKCRLLHHHGRTPHRPQTDQIPPPHHPPNLAIALLPRCPHRPLPRVHLADPHAPRHLRRHFRATRLMALHLHALAAPLQRRQTRILHAAAPLHPRRPPVLRSSTQLHCRSDQRSRGQHEQRADTERHAHPVRADWRGGAHTRAGAGSVCV